MKILILSQLIMFLITGTTNPTSNIQIGTLSFTIDHLPSKTGCVRVVLYDKADQFLSQYGYFQADSAYVNKRGSTTVTFTHLPYGQYAAAIYLDENVNGVIDRNMVGVPTEPYGFSNDVKAKYSIPSFQSTKFTFQSPVVIVTSRLQYWSKQNI